MPKSALDLPIPLSLKPMEAEPVDDLPRGKGWLYEPKYDGFRCRNRSRLPASFLKSPLALLDWGSNGSCWTANLSSLGSPSKHCNCGSIQQRAG